MRHAMAVLALAGLATVSPARAQDGPYTFAKEIAIDAPAGKVVATIPLEGKPEAAQADTKAGKIYAHEDSATLLKVVQTLKTKQGARTMTLDPLTHATYLAVTDYEPRPAGSKERPKAVAGTFRVLAYQMTK